MTTALVMHEACGRHDTGWGHPEHMGRLPAVLQALYRDTILLQDHTLQAEAELATTEDVLRVHAPELWQRVQNVAATARERNQIIGLDHETLVSPASLEAALGAAGSVITACRLVLSGQARYGFALARPPGHHATTTQSMGFCLINNVAIAARWLQSQGVGKVLVIDWDVHHGNGTQDIFYNDSSVYYLSLHQHPHYPGTGFPHERGAGNAIGQNLNIQLAAGTTGAEFREVFERTLDRVLAGFTPDFVLVSAGFDCLRGDPLGGLNVEPKDLYELTRHLLSTVECGVVHTLEGGYAPARVGEGVVAVMRALAGVVA